MKICSREYEIRTNKSVGGARFYSWGKNSKGTGLIEIGNYDKRTCAELLMHEITEAILVEDGKRFIETDREKCNERYLFMFTHDYLDTFGPKLLEAITTSGFFELK